jgi:CxxC motif-containing protein (DUF1111 family)
MFALFISMAEVFGGQADSIKQRSENATAAGHRLSLFRKHFTSIEGLGPEFNAVSCVSCHNTPVVGGSGTVKHQFVEWAYNADSDALGAAGQRFAVTPTGATVQISSSADERRKPPPLFGLGLLEAISIDDLRSHSDPFDADRDGVSGRLPLRDDCYGRFGWQSTVCDIGMFVEGALNNELGIETKPRSRREISKSDVLDLAAYVRGLPPPQTPPSHEGADLFERALCAKCHRPVSGVATVADHSVQVRAYTDLLVHEMGNGRHEGDQDSRTEFRTPPLWGNASTGPPYLHDGSAASLEDAILHHAGEAADSRRRFSTLNRAEKLQLLQFVSTR